MSDQDKVNQNQFMSKILEAEQESVVKISENEFRRYLLPTLAMESEQSDLRMWLAITGSWRRPIDVVDEKGERLFRVPALVGENSLPFRQGPRNSTYEIIQNAKRKMESVPRAGIEYMRQHLTNRVNAQGDRSKAAQEWKYIFERYGLDYPDEVKNTQDNKDNNDKSENNSGVIDDVIESYEDL